MKVQWYPGQMAKATRLLAENSKLVDAVIEVLDARIPASSRNPAIRQILEIKPLLAVLTHADLADPGMTKKWLQLLQKDYLLACPDAKSYRELRNASFFRKIPRKEKQEVMRWWQASECRKILSDKPFNWAQAIIGNKPGYKIKAGLKLADNLEF